ncbi:MAG: posphoenolpyruvate synthetase regulatory kinase/phosphorylase PpsR [Lysobacteraceae bacterium]
MSQARPVFYVSDGTGITAENVGNSLLTQFENVVVETRRLPFVDSEEKARDAAEVIRRAGERSGLRPIVVNTIVDERINAALTGGGGLMLDVFSPFMTRLEEEFGTRHTPQVNRAHGIVDFGEYEQRMHATNFALTHDDGMDLHYDQADVILVGVSRSGKTPTCLYMALHFGVKAANYPLTPDDLENMELPPSLVKHRAKLFGLTIDPVRLQQIRQVRRPNSRYATIEQCRREVAAAETLLKSERIPMLNTTRTSVEEISSKILSELGIERHMF